MANGVINSINGMINAINKVHFDIPDWVPGFGGNRFGFNIPTINNIVIPKLAQGGFVKANTPQLAMIGDNKTQGEIVAPENKMLDMIITALKMFKQQDTAANNNDKPVEIILNLDGDLAVLARILKPYLDSESKRKGYKLILGGSR